MKIIICLSTCMASCIFLATAQVIDPGKTAKSKVENRANNKADASIDKSLDKMEEGIKGLFKKKKKKEAEQEKEGAATEASKSESATVNKAGSTGGNDAPSFQVYSKYDFIPGEKVLYYDDFEATEVGDFPTGWNTNSSAQVVTLSNLPGKWLSITKDGFFSPELIKDMPENFTLEFDVVNRYRSNNILGYNFIIYKSANPRKDIGEVYVTDASFRFNWAGCSGGLGYVTHEKGEEMGKNDDLSSEKLVCLGDDFATPAKIKFSLWRQKNRLRVYLNEEKVLDIPQAFNSTLKYNVFKLGAIYMNYSNGREHDDEFMVSNLRYAVGAPDTRSKLITTGKFSTTGILFDVNSDKINPSSYGTLKEIATVLKENPAVKVKIIGHTDSDGDDKANLLLSQKRAAAVKENLSSSFGIDAGLMETDGKGEAVPAEPNTTSQGKANNRRVEFIKL